MNFCTDTAIVGAGPVGCLTALTLARKSNEITVFEADASSKLRFAGEWLHPAGIEALRRTGVLDERTLDSCTISHRGFAIFPDDGSEPIQLDYPGTDRGLVCEHNALVDMLRRKAIETPGVKLISGARVEKVERGGLLFRVSGKQEMFRCDSRRIVGADGKSSLVRPALGLPRHSQLISYMAGLLLRDIELPFEGYGHVILGAPGPILFYRVSPDTVRASIDVPAAMGGGKVDWNSLLAREYADSVPAALRPAFLRALATETIMFRANRYRPRIDYGDESLSLVGDAVGFQHPLTAMGMTLGFQDAEGLARCSSFAEFQKERCSQTLVPELLAMALYKAFSGREPGAREVRRAIYAMWRRYPVERDRTMQLLSGKTTSPFRFSVSFLRGVQLALTGSVLSENYRLQLGQLNRTLGSIGQILQGLVTCSSARFARPTPESVTVRAS